MSSSATMQQAKTEAAQPAQRSSQLATQHQQRNSSAAQSELSDLRPQATAQRQLQDTANNSPQSHQLNTFQQMAQNSARATQLKAMSTMMNAPAVQRVEEDDEPLQAKSAGETAQREAADAAEAPQPNNTGLPDNLKSGIESMSGMSMDHVKVHYNSAQPAQLNAHAYAQGSEIHVAPGQEQHLPHEAWHVVQQAQGRVQPTMQMKVGVPVNDDAGLEAEADVMGAKALGLGAVQMRKEGNVEMSELTSSPSQPIQQKEPKNSSSIDVNAQNKALNPAKGESNVLIQKYSYDPTPAEITLKHPKGTHKWIESTGAKVSWKKGEIMDPNSIGSHTVHNHGWVGLLKNQSNGNNATGLHVVNANWGGSANALDGNLVPGTPSLNGHHKSIENKVHNLFKNNGGKAPENMSYEADVWTPYDQTMDLTKNKSGEELPYKDAIIKCTVIAGTETLVDNEQVELGGGTKIVVP
ncbi:DUF4157 domain-containing protein [Undibacterium sp. CY21W]|uniref:eCIS core domain-containing protein n=1 Tax=Undibacterium sp. CY21W TaxID=2762293 RepID=UPI002101E2AC|nr:DUF4157 domain-containing protein [Undibacterium sp. CY21W]